MLFEPGFRPFEVAPRVARQALDVERKQRRVPVRFEAFLDDAVRLIATAERDKALSRGGRNTTVAAIVRRKLVPELTQGPRIQGFPLEVFGLGVALELLEQGRLEHLALLELRQQQEYLIPVARELLRLQLEAQRSRVLVLQLGQRLQRIVIAAVIEQ